MLSSSYFLSSWVFRSCKIHEACISEGKRPFYEHCFFGYSSLGDYNSFLKQFDFSAQLIHSCTGEDVYGRKNYAFLYENQPM